MDAPRLRKQQRLDLSIDRCCPPRCNGCAGDTLRCATLQVAYAETQSMFLDSLAGDAAWLARYARTLEGAAMPWDVIERKLRSTQPFDVVALRSMLSVPYFERALYELPEAEVTPQRILELADEVEARIEGGPAPRTLMRCVRLAGIGVEEAEAPPTRC